MGGNTHADDRIRSAGPLRPRHRSRRMHRGAAGPRKTEPFGRAVAVDPESSLIVINHDGNVAVGIHGREEINITVARRSVYGKSELERVRIEVTEGNHLRVETVHTTSNAGIDLSGPWPAPPPVTFYPPRTNLRAFDDPP